MTSPPLGVGYPDGGYVSSLWGDPLLVYPPATTPSNTTMFSGYVGNWSAVQLFLQSSFALVLWQYTWYADAALTIVTGSGDTTTGGGAPIAEILLSNQGPYLTVIASTAAATPTNMAIVIVPSAGVAQSPIGFVSGAYNLISAVLASNTSTSINVSIVRSGRAALSVQANAQTGSATVIAEDYTATNNFVGGVAQTVALSPNTVDIVCPPMPLTLTIRNNGAAAATIIGSLTFAPN